MYLHYNIYIMDIILKAVMSGVFAGIILWLSGTRYSYLGGILLFFPIISLPTFFFMSQSGQVEKMRQTIWWSVWSIPVWLCFAAVLYIMSYKIRPVPAVLTALGAWFLAATLLVFIKK